MGAHVTRRKLTKKQLKDRGKRAEQLKGKKGVKNPFAAATAEVKRRGMSRRRG